MDDDPSLYFVEDLRQVGGQSAPRKSCNGTVTDIRSYVETSREPAFVELQDSGVDRTRLIGRRRDSRIPIPHQLERQVVRTGDAKNRPFTHEVLVQLARRSATRRGDVEKQRSRASHFNQRLAVIKVSDTHDWNLNTVVHRTDPNVSDESQLNVFWIDAASRNEAVERGKYRTAILLAVKRTHVRQPEPARILWLSRRQPGEIVLVDSIGNLNRLSERSSFQPKPISNNDRPGSMAQDCALPCRA